MGRLHICNTFFEEELETGGIRPLKEWFNSHPAMKQLQYLPLLYAGREDQILVSELPENPDPRLCLKASGAEIDSWGASLSIAKYAQDYGHSYRQPDISVVRSIQSKRFAFEQCPLPGAAVLSTEREVEQWIARTEGRKVLKRMLGTSGRGHCFVERGYQSFIQREFASGRPVLAEPWVNRTMDFSTQWEIGDTIDLIGVTRFETSATGSYLATLAGPFQSEFLDEHLEVAWPVVQKIRGMGFFGSLGIDAFVYDDQLHPIVEINARKTMSRVALEIQRAHDRTIRMSFEKKPGGLLPGTFVRNIFVLIN